MSLIHKKAFTYDELISCAKGELFGPGNPQLPLPPMLMTDRITSIRKRVVSLIKDILKPNWISILIYGFSPAILKVILLCQAVSAWMACGS